MARNSTPKHALNIWIGGPITMARGVLIKLQ